MKAILINATERKVVAADVKPDPNKSLDGLHTLIGCEWVQPVIVGENLTLWLDEEGWLKLPKPGFRLSGIATDFVGNGILLGGDADRVKPCRVACLCMRCAEAERHHPDYQKAVEAELPEIRKGNRQVGLP